MYFGERKPRTRLDKVLMEYAFAGSHKVLDVVIDNWQVLKKADMLEEAFIDAWSTCKYGMNWDEDFFQLVFSSLDKAKLRKAGDPLPDGEAFTVYRGVAGEGAARRERGYCWSLDESVARFFSTYHQGLPDPAVYRAMVQREHVLAYINESGRNEQELIILPEHVLELKRLAATNLQTLTTT
jgi:hypothetical protein